MIANYRILYVMLLGCISMAALADNPIVGISGTFVFDTKPPVVTLLGPNGGLKRRDEMIADGNHRHRLGIGETLVGFPAHIEILLTMRRHEGFASGDSGRRVVQTNVVPADLKLIVFPYVFIVFMGSLRIPIIIEINPVRE